jgi:hypothetical protein
MITRRYFGVKPRTVFERASSVALFCLAASMGSCDQITRVMCGELPEFEQEALSGVRAEYDSVAQFSPIPCEQLYIDVTLKGGKVDTTTIRSIHKVLFDDETKRGWQTMNIFSRDNRYLFSHHHSGTISLGY